MDHAERHLPNGNDPIDWDAIAAIIGETLWEVAAGVLQPVDNPTDFSLVTSNTITFNAGNQFNVTTTDSAQFTVGDQFIATGGDVMLSTGTSDNIQLSASGAPGTFLFSMRSQSGNDAFNLSAAGNPIRLGFDNADRIIQRAETSAVGDGTLFASSISFWIDESTNELKVQAKYADGTTVKSGTICALA
jgi:hypothetical protein